MEREYRAITLLNNVTPTTITSSTDATPIVVTATAHGLQSGQRALIYGHATNVAANGIYRVTRLSANTFSLQDEITGANIAGSGAGSGSGGIVLLAPPVVYMKDFRNAVLQLYTSGTATTTIKSAASLGKPSVSASSTPGDGSTLEPTMPNFGATVSSTNPYSFVQLLNLNAQETVAGATGVVVAGTDIGNMYEVNFNALTYWLLLPVSWSAGAITAILFVTNNI